MKYKLEELFLILFVWGLVYTVTGIVIASFFCKLEFGNWLAWLKG